ncbi:hypothetical protein TIFTF001_007583 [Ficus carica]|uniref:Uncharacterized protein n=1 Tax=Ficus carica TaxID=3494 RepID=A0AA87ZQL4_FICCA|nr:hypothetical protein TIFTF001_007583 [Ficus carica]
MKTAPSSTRSYYFQGYQGTFIPGCSDSNKNCKHLWFYATGKWLSGRENYDRVPSKSVFPSHLKGVMCRHKNRTRSLGTGRGSRSSERRWTLSRTRTDCWQTKVWPSSTGSVRLPCPVSRTSSPD